MISVLVTTYNGAEYVIEQLESIRNQTRPVDAVVISDDVSSDGTADLVRKFIQENHLTGWTLRANTENLGPAGNSFRLLSQASGDVVFFADQDDVWEPDKVQVMTAMFEANPDVVALTSVETLIDAVGRRITDESVLRGFGRNVRPFDGWVDLGLRDFLGNSSVPWHATCVRREVIDGVLAGGLPEVGRSLGADWYVGLVATLTGKFWQLGQPLMWRRIHSTNASLGRLRKSTLLSTDNDRRRVVLAEIGAAHRFLLGDSGIAQRLDSRQKSLISQVAVLFARRLEFSARPSPMKWLRLGGLLGVYRTCYRSWKAALRMWATDLLYAYRINWATGG